MLRRVGRLLRGQEPAGDARLAGCCTVARHGVREQAARGFTHVVIELRNARVVLQPNTETRANMSDFHSIAVRFLPHNSVDEDTLTLLDDHLRRRLADLGLRAPAADSQDASDAQIVIQVNPLYEELQPSVQDERGRLHKIGIQLKTNSIRFKARDTRRGGFRVGHAHEDAHQSEAVDASIDGVTLKFADAFLNILIRESFSRYPIPEP